MQDHGSVLPVSSSKPIEMYDPIANKISQAITATEGDQETVKCYEKRKLFAAWHSNYRCLESLRICFLAHTL